MEVAITLCAETNLAKPIFVGSVLDPGNHMEIHGIIAIVMTKMTPNKLEKDMKNPDLLCNVIFSTVIDTETICNHSNSKTSCTPWQRKKWRKCKITICPGLRLNS